MRRTPIKTIVVTAIAAMVALLIAAPVQAAPGDPITVSGYVTDSNGDPVPWHSVQVWGGTNFLGFAQTDFSGYYEIAGTSVTEVETLAVHAGTAVCDALPPFSAPATFTVNCQIPTMWTVTISGTASSTNGEPVEGLWLQFAAGPGFPQGTSIGVDGYYEITLQVPENAVGIDVHSPFDMGIPVTTVTGFYDGAVLTNVDIAFYVVPAPVLVDIEVSGTVSKRNGKPLADVLVQVEAQDGTVYETFSGVDGTYSLTYEGYWDQDWNWVTPAFVSINGEWVEYLGTASATEPNIVNYRVGKTAVFEPFALGLDLTGSGDVTDIYRKAEGTDLADWRVCNGLSCYGAEFGSRKTELFDVTPIHGLVGAAEVLVRERNGAEYDWWRLTTGGLYDPATTFGPQNFDGYDYVDLDGYGGFYFIAWADKGRQTSIWTWDDALALGVTTQVLDGRFVSIDFVDLDGDMGQEVVVVTRKGNKYTVNLINSSVEEPVAVATGRGVPTVSYEDLDNNGILEVVVAYS